MSIRRTTIPLATAAVLGLIPFGLANAAFAQPANIPQTQMGAAALLVG
jgi:hypothetical protein